jgi:Transposase IS66 family
LAWTKIFSSFMGGTPPRIFALAKPAVWFAFTTDRRAEHPKSMLKDFRGYLQADAYPGYDDLYRSGRIVEVACWGHARRKIFDLHENRPTAVTTGSRASTVWRKRCADNRPTQDAPRGRHDQSRNSTN